MADQEEVAEVIDIVERHVKRFRETALTQISRKRDPYQTLVSCIISLRTKDETTAKASRALFLKARTPEGMVCLSEEEIGALIRPANYYKTKAKNIRKISQILIENHGSKVPDDFDELLKLPGVGRKTANIVMVFGFGRMGLPIDTHCHRIPNRLGWVKTKTPERTEFALRKLIPQSHWMKFNDVFVTFGQNVCKPVKPLCGVCPITNFCEYYERNVLPGIESGKR